MDTRQRKEQKWAKSNKTGLCNLYSSPSVRVVGYITKDKMDGARSRHKRNVKCIKVWSRKFKGRHHLGDLGVDGTKITLR